MIISHAGQWVAFAPWKTASSTQHSRLSIHNQSAYSRFYYFNEYLNRVVHQHLTCADFVCLPESKLGYSKFSFVRNPYDRCYSGFLQLHRAVQNQPSMSFEAPWIKSLVLSQLKEVEADLAAAGGDFDTWMLAVREEQIFEIGRNTTFVLHPAHYWTHIAGTQYVDEIGRVESFEEDFDRICRRFSIAAAGNKNANVTSDVGSDGSYKYVGRMNGKTIDRINALFADDFDIFEYKKI